MENNDFQVFRMLSVLYASEIPTTGGQVQETHKSFSSLILDKSGKRGTPAFILADDGTPTIPDDLDVTENEISFTVKSWFGAEYSYHFTKDTKDSLGRWRGKATGIMSVFSMSQQTATIKDSKCALQPIDPELISHIVQKMPAVSS